MDGMLLYEKRLLFYMCDINKISKEKDEITARINDTLIISGATILGAETYILDIEFRAKKNIEELSALL